MNVSKNNNLKKAIAEPEVLADKIVEKTIELLGKERLIKHIRHSHFLSSMLGAAGLALFLVGVEKVFGALSGWFSITLGIIFLVISGALFQKLK